MKIQNHTALLTTDGVITASEHPTRRKQCHAVTGAASDVVDVWSLLRPTSLPLCEPVAQQLRDGDVKHAYKTWKERSHDTYIFDMASYCCMCNVAVNADDDEALECDECVHMWCHRSCQSGEFLASVPCPTQPLAVNSTSRLRAPLQFTVLTTQSHLPLPLDPHRAGGSLSSHD